MTTRRFELDASRLPEAAHGHRAAIWWAMVLLVTIEGTMFALALASYFYIRGYNNLWPPASGGRLALYWAAAGAAALALSAPAMALTARAAVRGSLRGMRRWILVTTALGVAFMVCRWRELDALPFRWDQNAYGSIVWTTLGLHTFHGVTSVLENLAFIAVLYRGPLEKEHLADIHSNNVYWSFVVVSGLLIAGVFYIERLGLQP